MFEDEGKAVTIMAVRITTPEKCPPLPPYAKVHLTLTLVWSDEGIKRLSLTEKLSTSFFYVYEVMSHDELQQCKCKNFIFEVKARCSGLKF